MKQYLKTQIKHLGKTAPFVALAGVILLAGLLLIFSGIMQLSAEDSNNQIFRIGIAGDIENAYFQMGKTAMETMDSSRFTMEFPEMTEEEARQALEQGRLSAYVVLPEGFMEKALHGEILPIQFVTSSGGGLSTMVKEEITLAIETLLIGAQKGIWGLWDVLIDNGQGDLGYDASNQLTIEYMDVIIHRDAMYHVQELGISDGLSLGEYMLCGISVLFFLIISIPYASTFVRKDTALIRMLCAKGISAGKQIGMEFSAFCIVHFAAVAAIFGVSATILFLLQNTSFFAGLPQIPILGFFIQSIPVMAMVLSFMLLLFEISGDMISGISLPFFVSIALCYCSGCLYPIHTLPVAMQKIAVYLPTGIAANYLGNCLSGNFDMLRLSGIALYAGSFLCLAVLVRKHKLARRT